MNNITIMILIKKEFTELVRSKKLLIGLAVFTFFSIMSPMAAKYMPQILAMATAQQGITITLPDPVYTDSLMQLVKNLSQIGLFVMIFLVMGMVVQEKERGTAAFLMVKPVSPGAFIIAKFVLMLLYSAILMLAAFAVTSLYTGILFGIYPWKATAAVCMILFVYMVVILSFTLLSSTLVKSQAAAGIIALVLWLLLSLLSQWGNIGTFLPGSLIGETEGAIFNMTPDWRPFAGSLVFTVASIGAAIAVFRRWEA